MTYSKSLIEVDLPINTISAYERRVKSIRYGHSHLESHRAKLPCLVWKPIKEVEDYRIGSDSIVNVRREES